MLQGKPVFKFFALLIILAGFAFAHCTKDMAEGFNKEGEKEKCEGAGSDQCTVDDDKEVAFRNKCLNHKFEVFQCECDHFICSHNIKGMDNKSKRPNDFFTGDVYAILNEPFILPEDSSAIIASQKVVIKLEQLESTCNDPCKCQGKTTLKMSVREIRKNPETFDLVRSEEDLSQGTYHKDFGEFYLAFLGLSKKGCDKADKNPLEAIFYIESKSRDFKQVEMKLDQPQVLKKMEQGVLESEKITINVNSIHPTCMLFCEEQVQSAAWLSITSDETKLPGLVLNNNSNSFIVYETMDELENLHFSSLKTPFFCQLTPEGDGERQNSNEVINMMITKTHMSNYTCPFVGARPIDKGEHPKLLRGTDIVSDKNYGFYFTGVFSLEGEENNPLYLTHLDNSNDISWFKDIGARSLSGKNHIVVDNAGDIYIAGETIQGIGGEEITGHRIFIAKYSESGDPIWHKYLGNADNTNEQYGVNDLIKTIDNKVVMAGFTHTALDNHNNSGEADAFVAQYDAEGELNWLQIVGSEQSEVGKAVVADRDGNITLLTSKGQIHLSHFSSEGEKLWSKAIESHFEEQGLDIVYKKDYGYFVSVLQGNNKLAVSELNEEGELKKENLVYEGESQIANHQLDINKEGVLFLQVGGTIYSRPVDGTKWQPRWQKENVPKEAIIHSLRITKSDELIITGAKEGEVFIWAN